MSRGVSWPPVALVASSGAIPVSGTCAHPEVRPHILNATGLELRRNVYPSALMAILAHASASLSAS